MSEEKTEENTPQEEAVQAPASNEVKLNGIYAFKIGMSSVYDESGEQVPVTVLKYEPWIVSQVKTNEKEGYEAVQISCRPRKESRTSGAQAGHLKGAGFENGAYFTREVRQALPEGVAVGQKVSLDSLEKGEMVKVTSKSKGRGFAGTVKRWNFGGGRASHGGKATLRAPGSIGNCEFPGRVMAGRKMSGHYGQDIKTVKNIKVVDIIPEESVVLVKGPVPGSKNTLVRLVKA